jgi:hypothetical protein
MSNEIELNGVKYAPVQPAPSGTRAVVVVDRGWVFAGDVSESDGKVTLERAINVRNWSSIAFNGMVKNPTSDKVTLDHMENPVEIPVGAILFRVPVKDSWGL